MKHQTERMLSLGAAMSASPTPSTVRLPDTELSIFDHLGTAHTELSLRTYATHNRIVVRLQSSHHNARGINVNYITKVQARSNSKAPGILAAALRALNADPITQSLLLTYGQASTMAGLGEWFAPGKDTASELRRVFESAGCVFTGQVAKGNGYITLHIESYRRLSI